MESPFGDTMSNWIVPEGKKRRKKIEIEQAEVVVQREDKKEEKDKKEVYKPIKVDNFNARKHIQMSYV